MSKKTSSWEKRMAERATKERAREKAGGGGGNKIGIDKRRFTLGGTVLGKELKVAIVDWVYLKTFYKKAYVPGERSAPSCYAISQDAELSPHDKVAKPVNDTCEGCPNNEFGTAKQGRGKACADKRRLGLIDVSDLEDADSVADAEFATLEIPPTALKGWAEYLSELEDKIKRPIFTVVTKITIDPDSDWPVPVFELEEKVEDEEVGDALEARIEEIREELLRPYQSADDEDEDEEEKPKRKKAKQKDDEDEDEEDDEEDDEDDEDDDEDDDEEDDEDDEPVRGKKRKGSAVKAGKRGKSSDDDDDDDEDEDEDDEKPKKKSKKSKDDDEDEDDDDADEPKKRKRSKFGK